MFLLQKTPLFVTYLLTVVYYMYRSNVIPYNLQRCLKRILDDYSFNELRFEFKGTFTVNSFVFKVQGKWKQSSDDAFYTGLVWNRKSFSGRRYNFKVYK